ncbi:MAG: putative pre-16S rRNA nuclease [Lysobacteraceae bacterium]|nr:MAG: putative pre-16S rRNA nuclease [Xanthomonadaceae bacterium]
MPEVATSPQPPPITILGFDFGMRRVGVAVGQTITATASALETLPARDGKVDWDRVAELINEWKPQRLVVGAPVNLDGQQQTIGKAANKFGQRLHGRFGLPVDEVDERMTSRAADRLFVDGRRDGSIRRRDAAKLDAVAARLIVETWLAQWQVSQDAT